MYQICKLKGKTSELTRIFHWLAGTKVVHITNIWFTFLIDGLRCSRELRIISSIRPLQFPDMVPRLRTHALFVAGTKFVSREAKTFLNVFRIILSPRLMFLVCTPMKHFNTGGKTAILCHLLQAMLRSRQKYPAFQCRLIV